MKQRIGELNSKQVVVTANPEEVTCNEILLEDDGTGVILKQRNKEGKLVEITKTNTIFMKPLKENTKEATNTDEVNNVYIALNSTIKGPSKWVKGSSYLFYINKNDKFIITDINTGEDKTGIANLVATGKTDKVYEIKNNEYSSIKIEEV